MTLSGAGAIYYIVHMLHPDPKIKNNVYTEWVGWEEKAHNHQRLSEWKEFQRTKNEVNNFLTDHHCTASKSSIPPY